MHLLSQSERRHICAISLADFESAGSHRYFSFSLSKEYVEMYGADKTASILGGEAVLGVKVRHDYDLEKLVIKGLPARTIDLLIERIYPEDKRQRWLIIPPSTYRRRQKSGHLTMFESERVERIARVYSMILSVWSDDEEAARCFMQTKHHLLDNRSPFEASFSELGARQVETILFRIEYGIFS